MTRIAKLIMSGALFISTGALATTGSSGIIESLNYQSTQKNVDKAVEHIEVYGQRPIGYFRQQLRLSESAFFDAFNELTDISSFKVECYNKKRIGTNVGRRRCEPAYVDEIKHEQRFLTSQLTSSRGNPLLTFPYAQLRYELQQKQKEHIAYMNKLASENPDLQAKLEKWAEAKMSYALKHYKKWGKRSGFARAIETSPQFNIDEDIDYKDEKSL